MILQENTLKCYCRNCKGERNHISLFSKIVADEEPDYNYFSRTDYQVIQCAGCETVSFLKIFGDSDMYSTDDYTYGEYFTVSTVYPLYLEDAEELKDQHHLPDQIRQIYSDTIKAFTIGAFILTAGGLRAIIEAVCKHEKMSTGNLIDKINSLHQNGKLTVNEANRLHSIRFLGNDALHEMAPPTKEQLLLLLNIVNHLLANLFITDQILHNKVATIIHNFDGFARHLKKLISKEMIGHDFTLKQILNKSIRQLQHKSLLAQFEKDLITNITNGQIDYLTVKDANQPECIFEVVRNPRSLRLSSL